MVRLAGCVILFICAVPLAIGDDVSLGSGHIFHSDDDLDDSTQKVVVNPLYVHSNPQIKCQSSLGVSNQNGRNRWSINDDERELDNGGYRPRRRPYYPRRPYYRGGQYRIPYRGQRRRPYYNDYGDYDDYDRDGYYDPRWRQPRRGRPSGLLSGLGGLRGNLDGNLLLSGNLGDQDRDRHWDDDYDGEYYDRRRSGSLLGGILG